MQPTAHQDLSVPRPVYTPLPRAELTTKLRVPRPQLLSLPQRLEPRLLCGPGPSNAHPRVHAAMSLPQVGHLDPVFLAIFEELKQGLRYLWQTTNELTLAISGTGSAAWEAAVANLTTAGDKHLVFVNGYFGDRHCEMASRYGAIPVPVRKPYGQGFTLAEMEAAIAKEKPALVWIAHAETSSGYLQDVRGLGAACRRHGALLLLDTVTSLGGVPVFLDEWEVDCAYSGGQKCLACPPGMSPLTFGPRAVAKMDERAAKGDKTKAWYLDVSLLRQYLSGGLAERSYHHTAPISSVYALREAISCVIEEGIENTWKRHRESAEYLWGELEAAGLELIVAKESRLPPLATVRCPQGVDSAKVQRLMRERFQVEIGGGLGDLKGKAWRIGLMGYNARLDVAKLVSSSLKECIELSRTSKL